MASTTRPESAPAALDQRSLASLGIAPAGEVH
jgi:hypothetical protein